MERIIPSLNISDSPIGKMEYSTRGRTDIKMSGLLIVDNIKWSSWITIEAPGNRNYSTMELDFSFINEVNELPDGTREPFNSESIPRWRSVFLNLLKEKTFKGFLQNWLNDISFDSVRK
ncbi:MAG: hypothetical protein JW866_06250 [Ignavibacteriales bacterium]|nr:hypothetical protein [Ignavibacteriales bacterium]